MNRLPSSDQFAKLSNIDQSGVLDFHRRQIKGEIDGLKSGDIWTTNGLTKGRALSNARAKMRRLKKLANSLGHWVDA